MLRKPLRLLSTKSTDMNIGKAGRSYLQLWHIKMETRCLVMDFHDRVGTCAVQGRKPGAVLEARTGAGVEPLAGPLMAIVPLSDNCQL